MLNIHFKEISLIMDDEKKIIEHINQNFKLYVSQSISEISNMINLEKHLAKFMTFCFWRGTPSIHFRHPELPSITFMARFVCRGGLSLMPITLVSIQSSSKKQVGHSTDLLGYQN